MSEKIDGWKCSIPAVLVPVDENGRRYLARMVVEQPDRVQINWPKPTSCSDPEAISVDVSGLERLK